MKAATEASVKEPSVKVTTEASSQEVEKLKSEITEQGNKVREVKSSNAAKV